MASETGSVRYRRHTSRWYALKQSSIIIALVTVAVWNGFRVVQGVITGGVMSLRRRAWDFVSFDLEPGWFVFNMSLRITAVLVLVLISYLLWKQLQRDMKN